MLGACSNTEIADDGGQGGIVHGRALLTGHDEGNVVLVFDEVGEGERLCEESEVDQICDISSVEEFVDWIALDGIGFWYCAHFV